MYADGVHVTSPRTITLNLTIVATPFDFDGDGDVDQSDFAIVQRCLSGANVAADPNCAD